MKYRALGGSTKKVFHFIEWTCAAIVLATVFVAWIQSRNIFERGVDEFSLFPLLGLMAFVLMWSHYIFGAVRRGMGVAKDQAGIYWPASSALVLVLIILHPLLLNYRLIADGLGLPPGSYELAYGNKAVFLVLGTACLLVFLMFELRRWFRDAAWWKYVEYAQVVAMIGIFIHSLELGRELTLPWFLTLWWIYGLLLVGAWVYNYRYDSRVKPKGVLDGQE